MLPPLFWLVSCEESPDSLVTLPSLAQGRSVCRSLQREKTVKIAERKVRAQQTEQEISLVF
jgi:hypothetical protein